jgi:hypothetical protein
MKPWIALGAFAAVGIAGALAAQGSTHVDPLIERGRYLVGFGRCNDCHTLGWRESDGSIPVLAQRLSRAITPAMYNGAPAGG